MTTRVPSVREAVRVRDRKRKSITLYLQEGGGGASPLRTVLYTKHAVTMETPVTMDTTVTRK